MESSMESTDESMDGSNGSFDESLYLSLSRFSLSEFQPTSDGDVSIGDGQFEMAMEALERAGLVKRTCMANGDGADIGGNLLGVDEDEKKDGNCPHK